MGYTIELGYMNGKDFEVAYVTPFVAGSNPQLPPPVIERSTLELLGSLSEQMERATPKPKVESVVDAEDEEEEQTQPAEICVTYNYSKRIGEITGGHLAHLDGQRVLQCSCN